MVHIHRPLSLFDHISADIIEKWWGFEDTKLLVIPFGTEVYNQHLHNTIKGCILATIQEITQSFMATIADPLPIPSKKEGLQMVPAPIRPPPNNSKPKSDSPTPTTFLIYKLSETHQQILLQCQVWALVNIAFHVAPLEPACPNFLFSIKNFSTLDNGGGITILVRKTWSNITTKTFLNSLAEEVPPPAHKKCLQALTNFINSMWVKPMSIILQGHSLNPEFNVYAKGALIQDTNLWSQV